MNAGDQIDRFVVEELFARGGMASIFRAKDALTGAAVALKVPHPESEGDVVYYDRFQRERAIYRELNHPGVVRAVDCERPSRQYIAMEWAEGRSLRRILEETPRLGPERAVRIATAICDVLHHIHSHGVVHRDLKPENIILNGQDEVTLIDFGLAARAGARRLTFGRLSRVMGTPDYISPEQVEGKRGGPRSDIYALGVILYEMLTGGTPFQHENPLVTMNARLQKRAPRLRGSAGEFPAGLERVLGKALERDPKERFMNALDFARALACPEMAMEPNARTTPEPMRQRALLPLLIAIPPVLFALLVYISMFR